jgi:YbgC/YbaW family acyl-CoA thioester hydrolase
MHKYEITIKENHLDTFGHVNNATYLELFEQARWEALNEHGVSVKKITDDQIGPVLLRVELKFKKELLLRENIEIRSELIDRPNQKVMKVRQEMVKSCGEVACEAIFDIGVMDLIKRKLVKLEGVWLELF